MANKEKENKEATTATEHKERKPRKPKNEEMRYIIYSSKKNPKEHYYIEFNTEKEANIMITFLGKKHIIFQSNFNSFVTRMLELTKDSGNKFELFEFGE